MRRYSLLVIIAVAGIAGGFAGPRIIVVYGQPAPSPSTAQLDANDIAAVDWWQAHPDLHRALHDAGDNRNELERFLAAVPEAQRDGARFLVQYMPLHDLTALKAPYLLENIELAYRAKREFPWGKSIPDEIFFNDVLPYANINESRDDWRRDFWDRFAPVVRDCRTASEAAQRLNEKVFATLNVRYSTQRRRADQGPQESIETGLASCTGLSILLVDACRAVGIPARLVGIPEWVNKRGNHTWVEMWDEKWHFTGACEPDQRGLNYAWFQHDASLALAEDWRHSIYAASYKHTGINFPMVWARGNKSVPAFNVTDHYATDRPVKGDNRVRLLVRVTQGDARQRVQAEVKVHSPSNPTIDQRGQSRDESHDTNDILAFSLPREPKYVIEVRHGVHDTRREHDTQDLAEQTIDIHLP